MRYAQIRDMDISDGPGVRVGFYVQGCDHHCHGCYNKETWNYSGGKKWTKETNNKIIQLMSKNYIEGLSLLGGDPICAYLHDDEKDNLLLKLVQTSKYLYPLKSIWLWTGYLIEELKNNYGEPKTELQKKVYPLLKYIDVIVDGPFIMEKKDLMLPYAGSTNQRVITLH